LKRVERNVTDRRPDLARLKRLCAIADILWVPEEVCASCGAKLAPDAPWCSLCYAPVETGDPDLTSAGAVDVAFTTGEVASKSDLADDLADAGYETGNLLLATEPQLVADPDQLGFDFELSLDSSVDTPATAPAAVGTWPCLGCGAANPMGADVCTECGLPFLAQAKTPPHWHIPGLGDIFQRSRGEQIGFIAVCGFAALGLLIGLMTLFGLLF
jgi:ribosomal protein L40E